jgi:RNA polymerase sigma-70 factor (ECF subfamily)
MLGNRHDAEDVAQQTLLKGLTGINGLRHDEQFGAWISRIARNLCIDFIRKRRRKPSLAARQADPAWPESRDYRELQAALAKLPEESKLTLMLYYFDARSTKNIAAMLDISQCAVQTRLCRARRQLRKLLDAQ